MRNIIVYSFDNSLEKLIRRKQLIPYQCTPGDRFMRGKWYYDSYYSSLFKVIDVKYKSGNVLDYAITKSDEGYNSYITTPLSSEDFIIDFDKSGLVKENIINSEKSYTGAEIRYWFFMNNIDCFNTKYRYFWTYVDTFSNNRISDKQKYFLYAGMRNDEYIHCRVIKDTGKEKVITEKEIEEYNRFMAEQKEKDMHNVIRYHERLMFESNNEQTSEEKMD
jgi:hypothetical protein